MTEIRHRIWLEAMAANPGGFALDGGWYGRPPAHVGMDNRGLWWRTSEEHATEMDRLTAARIIRDFRQSGFVCRAEPPFEITERF
jgi:hypothetical protein